MVGKRSVLVVDDERLIRWAIAQRLDEEGLAVVEAENGAEALARSEHVDAVVLDFKLPDRSGFEVLRVLRRRRPELPVVMLTGHASVEHAVEAMKLGAWHYVAKPCDVQELVLLLRDAMRERPAPPSDAAPELIGPSPAMQGIRRMVDRVAGRPKASAVLVTGESGTGKSLVARAIHARDARREGAFVSVTCSALPPTLFESELFGHERGAFTGAEQRREGLLERADGGTLLLDEIAEMPSELQAKLLGVLERKRYRRVGGTEERALNARVVAATNVDLDEAVASGTFRRDLYYRLAVVTVHLPPLRERPEDVPPLVEHFLAQVSAELEVDVRLREGTLEALAKRPWPGNARQVRNAIERALLLSDADDLGPDDFGPAAEPAPAFVLPATGVDLEELERDLLEQALGRVGGNQRLAGEMLGMNRDQVRYRMSKYEISGPRDSDD